MDADECLGIQELLIRLALIEVNSLIWILVDWLHRHSRVYCNFDWPWSDASSASWATISAANGSLVTTKSSQLFWSSAWDTLQVGVAITATRLAWWFDAIKHNKLSAWSLHLADLVWCIAPCMTTTISQALNHRGYRRRERSNETMQTKITQWL